MTSKSSPQARSFWAYFMAAMIFSALVVSIVVIFKTYLDDGTNHQPVASMQSSANSQASEAAPLHTGPVVRADAVNSYEARLQKLEDWIIETQDASAARSRQLEIWLGQTQNAYEARFEQIEQRMVSVPTPNDITTTNNLLPDPGAYEPRLQQLEMWMTQNRETYEIRLAELEERLYQTQETAEIRFEQMEHRRTQANVPYEERLQNVEQQLNRAVDESRAKLQKIEKILIHTASRLDDLSAVIVAQAEYKDTIVAINETTVAEPPAALPRTPAAVSHTMQPHLQTSGNLPLEENLTKGQPYAIEGQNPPPSVNSGNWAINLASYSRKSIAARKMAEFQENGVQVRMTSAIVRGKIMYRLQVAGFASFEAAKLAVPSIRQQLNLKDTWITRI
ncbi:MAG: SPOR domain-containing protein [Pseudomonadota bacterium]